MKKFIIIYVILVMSILLFYCQKPDQKTQIDNTIDTPNKEVIEECQKFIEVQSAEFWSNEIGQSPQYIQANFKINTFEKESLQGKGRYVGELLPGSRALIIKEGIEEYYVKSPYDKTIGWISKVQVSRVVKQNINTYEECE